MREDTGFDQTGARYRENAIHIEVKNLYKSFGSEKSRIDALKGIDLEIKRGEALGIVGASGAGKSTLLHILGGLDSPTGGAIFYDGLDLFSLSDRGRADFRNKRIGFIFQFHYLLSEFSALENIMMPALIRGIKRKEAGLRAEKILVEFGLKERISHRPGELSGGEAQRVAIGRALVLEPEVILADEPTGNLDSTTGEEVENFLLDLNRRKGTTMIIVTHNPELAGKMERTITMADGRVGGS